MYVPLCAASLALSPLRAHSSSEEPYRVLPPSGGLAPHPAVMLVPGCSGFAAHNGVNLYDERAAELQAAGYVVVFVDYIARRMQSNCAHVSPAEAGSEILEAAMWTKRQSGIDANRISVIAWSYGARGVLTALETMPPDTPIAKVVMYYPVCRGASAWSTPAVGLILLGAMDDIAYPALCEAVVKGMSPDKLRVITYPNARHGFDMRGLPERSDHLAGAPAYNPDAAKASWSEVLAFLAPRGAGTHIRSPPDWVSRWRRTQASPRVPQVHRHHHRRFPRLAILDAYRSLCVVPEPPFRRMLEEAALSRGR
jgi:dienelactone hydrolase